MLDGIVNHEIGRGPLKLACFEFDAARGSRYAQSSPTTEPVRCLRSTQRSKAQQN